jgi:hypothetical protein
VTDFVGCMYLKLLAGHVYDKSASIKQQQTTKKNNYKNQKQNTLKPTQKENTTTTTTKKNNSCYFGNKNQIICSSCLQINKCSRSVLINID